MPNLSDEIKNKIKVLRKDFKLDPLEIKNHEIMKKNDDTRYNLDVIKYWCKRVDETGDVKVAKRSGRPRKLNEDQERKLIDTIDKYPMKFYNEIKRKANFYNVTRRTINNYGLRNGIRSYTALKKPPLDKAHITERLNFCNKWLARPEDCKRMIIVDEKLFNGHPTNNVVQVKRRKGAGIRFENRYISSRKKSNQNSSCNILISIGPFGKGELALAEHINWFNQDGTKIKTDGKPPGFDHTSYEHVLKTLIIPSARVRMLNNYLFLQDNASIHTFKEENAEKTNAQKLFDDEKIELVKFPPRSPDMTPIENVLSIFSREYEKLFEKLKEDYYPKNKKDTFRLLKIAWHNLDNNAVKGFIFHFIKGYY